MDIEEDIKILEKFKNNEMQRDKLERDSRCGGWKIGDIYKKLELNIAIEHILAEREEDKKRIAELEAKLEFYQWGDLDNLKFEEYMKEFIPKQKVKDKIEEIKEDKESKYFDKFLMTRDIDYAIEILEELLEDK